MIIESAADRQTTISDRCASRLGTRIDFRRCPAGGTTGKPRFDLRRTGSPRHHPPVGGQIIVGVPLMARCSPKRHVSIYGVQAVATRDGSHHAT